MRKIESDRVECFRVSGGDTHENTGKIESKIPGRSSYPVLIGLLCEGLILGPGGGSVGNRLSEPGCLPPKL